MYEEHALYYRVCKEFTIFGNSHNTLGQESLTYTNILAGSHTASEGLGVHLPSPGCQVGFYLENSLRDFSLSFSLYSQSSIIYLSLTMPWFPSSIQPGKCSSQRLWLPAACCPSRSSPAQASPCWVTRFLRGEKYRDLPSLALGCLELDRELSLSGPTEQQGCPVTQSLQKE